MNHRLARRRRDAARLLLLSGTALTLPLWPAFAETVHQVATATEFRAALDAIKANPNDDHVIHVTADFDAQGTVTSLPTPEGRSVAITGPGRILNSNLSKAGPGDLKLDERTAFGLSMLDGGTTAIGHDDAFGTGGVTMRDARLHASRDLFVDNDFGIIGRGESRISAATGSSLTLAGSLHMENGHHLHIGSAQAAGTVVLQRTLGNAPTGRLTIDGGTLQLGSASAGQFLTQLHTRVTSSALLDLHGFDAAVASLSGTGTVGNNSATKSTLRVLGDGQFAGRLEGNLVLLKSHVGEFTLSGDNRHTGGTTVVESRLIMAHRNALGTGPLTIYNGYLRTAVDAQLDQTIAVQDAHFDTGDRSVVLTGAISGHNFQKEGSGSLTLNAASTLTGSFTMDGGSLILNHQQGLGTAGLAFKSSGTSLIVNRDLALANEIGWYPNVTSCLAVADGRTLRLGGRIFYGTGATVIFGSSAHRGTIELANSNVTNDRLAMLVAFGTVRIGSGAAGASTQGTAMTIAADAALDLNGFNAALRELNGRGWVRNGGSTLSSLRVGAGGMFAGTISGNTQLVLGEEAAVLTLTGRNTYTGATRILGGTLRVAGGEALPDTTDVEVSGGTLDVQDSEVVRSLSNRSAVAKGTVAVAGDATLTAGSLNGGGAIAKTGAGTLALTGLGDHSGALDVMGGALLLKDAASASRVALHDGSALYGSGRIGRLEARAGSSVSPGTPLGTLTVSGDTRFDAGSAYVVDVAGERRSDLIDSGGRATLQGGVVNVRAGQAYYENANTYTILRAAGGRSGQFAGVTSDLAFLSPTLAYNPNEVQLQLNRNRIAFPAVARTPNQISAASAADGLESGHRVHAAILGLTADQAVRAFDQISGEVHASVASALLEDSRLIREAALERLHDPFEGAPTLPVPDTGSVPRDARSGANRALLNPYRTVVWGQAVGGFAQARTDGNAASVQRTTGGYIMGLEHRIAEGVTVGMAGGYTQTSLSGARSSSVQVDSYHAALYAGFDLGSGWMVRVGAAYTRHEIEADRSVAFSLFRDRLAAKYSASTLQAFGELAYKSRYSWGTIEPFLQVAAVRVSTGGFSENGGPAALVGIGRTQDALFTTLGVRFAVQPFADLPLTFRGMVGWRHAFGDIRPDAHVAFRGTPRDFSVWGVPLAKDSLVAELALDYKVNKRTTVGVSYSAVVSARQQDHAIKAYLSITF